MRSLFFKLNRCRRDSGAHGSQPGAGLCRPM